MLPRDLFAVANLVQNRYKTANIYILETHEVAIAYKADRYKTATT